MNSTRNTAVTLFCGVRAHPYRRLSIPNHKEFAKGTLRALIREAGLTVEEFAKVI
jgi:hypothetical protein